jgi:hypothetical protein
VVSAGTTVATATAAIWCSACPSLIARYILSYGDTSLSSGLPSMCTALSPPRETLLPTLPYFTKRRETDPNVLFHSGPPLPVSRLFVPVTPTSASLARYCAIARRSIVSQLVLPIFLRVVMWSLAHGRHWRSEQCLRVRVVRRQVLRLRDVDWRRRGGGIPPITPRSLVRIWTRRRHANSAQTVVVAAIRILIGHHPRSGVGVVRFERRIARGVRIGHGHPALGGLSVGVRRATIAECAGGRSGHWHDAGVVRAASRRVLMRIVVVRVGVWLLVVWIVVVVIVYGV